MALVAAVKAGADALLPQRLRPSGFRFKNILFVVSTSPSFYVLNFGRYRRKVLHTVPSTYLRWIINDSPWRRRKYWASLAQEVLNTRALAPRPPVVVDHYGPVTPDQLDYMCRCGVTKRECLARRDLSQDALYPPLS